MYKIKAEKAEALV